jgi:hypothetical protein
MSYPALTCGWASYGGGRGRSAAVTASATYPSPSGRPSQATSFLGVVSGAGSCDAGASGGGGDVIASGERCEGVAEKRSEQRTTAYTGLLAHATDDPPRITLIYTE